MRCVSKCFMGRSFKVYLFLCIGMLLGFFLSTLLQVVHHESFGSSRNSQEARPARQGSHVAEEDTRQRIELAEYDFPEEQRLESEVVDVDGNVSPAFKKPAESLHAVKLQNRDYQGNSWQGRSMKEAGDLNHLSGEVSARQTLLIAVVTSVSRLMTQTLAIQGTWGPRASHVVFFVGEVARMPHLPHNMDVVQLEGVDDQSGGWDLKEISTIKYLMDHYVSTVDWFMLTNDETYVAALELENKLNVLSANDPVYMGRPMEGENEGSVLCHQDPGVIYSRTLVMHLREYLPTCWPGGQSVEGTSLKECLKVMQIRCNPARQMKNVFQANMKSLIESPMLFSQTDLSTSLVLHPVLYPKYMYRLHSYFLELEHNASVIRTKELVKKLQNAQPFIPSHLRSPFQVIVHSEPTQKLSPPLPKPSPIGGVVLRPRHIPKNKFEINYWEYFNQTRLMSIMHESPARGIIGGFREEARFALTKAIYLANQGLPQTQRYVFDKLDNGYHRVDPMRGSEFILDFVFHRHSDKKVKLKKRLSILRPFHETVLPVEAPEVLPTVNFLVTLSGLSVRLERFLIQYERNVLMLGEEATLTIVLFENPDAYKVRMMVQEYLTRNERAQINIVDLQGEFARGVGLHHGMKRFTDEQLVFIVDVDLDVSNDFLQRCRLNVIPKKQVYFPVFFKLYNQDFVSRYHRGNHSLKIARHLGHWAHYSYGMVCMHAGDYHRLKGFDISMKGWGEEDVDLLNQVLKSGVEVFRAPDPGLIHNWHTKSCSKEKISDPAAYEHCLQSKGENLADRIELARYVFEKERLSGNML